MFDIITLGRPARRLQGSGKWDMRLLHGFRQQPHRQITYLYSDHAQKGFGIDWELPKERKLNGFALRKNTAGTS
jgi:hypothetical protein